MPVSVPGTHGMHPPSIAGAASPLSQAELVMAAVPPPLCLTWLPGQGHGGVTAARTTAGRQEQRWLFLCPAAVTAPVPAHSPVPGSALAVPTPSRTQRDRARLLVTAMFCSPCKGWAGCPHQQWGPSGVGGAGCHCVAPAGMGRALLLSRSPPGCPSMSQFFCVPLGPTLCLLPAMGLGCPG